MTPLLYAAINPYCRNLRKLIEYGANVNAKSKHGKTALHILMDAYPENDTLKCIDLLLAEGVAVNARDCRGNTALHTPFLEYWKKVEGEREKNRCERYAVKALKKIAGAGGDLSIANRRGDTPLHTVARVGGMRKLFKAMVDAGADPEAVNHQGETPSQILLKGKFRRKNG